MWSHIRNRYLLLTDLFLLVLAAYLSFVLRLERWAISGYQLEWLVFTAVVIVVVPFSLYALGCYARYWRYTSLDDLVRLALAVAFGALVGSCLNLIFVQHGVVFELAGLRVEAAHFVVPRSIPVIFLLLALVAVVMPRLAIRLVPMLRRRPRAAVAPRRVLVVGAGNAGEMLVRELRRNEFVDTTVVGLIDDDPLKQGQVIHGVPVLGDRYALPRVVQQEQVDQVILALPSVPGKTIRAIAEIAERTGVPAKIIPGIHDLIDGKVSLSQIRDVQIEDLLRREPIRTNISDVRALVQGRRVLITGGGGSIGSELCRQVLSFGPAELIILGHGENSVFEIFNELNALLPATQERLRRTIQLRTVIADIRFRERIFRVVDAQQPEIIFHAAAHKHVPLMEQNPAEAVTNNILGTQNLVDAARSYGVEHFVMISTDKAVNPTSIMGVCKRVAELIVHQAAMSSGKSYVAVRFGNVLGSRGSVVLTFKKQIAAGGPVTVTDPEMRRYFMTIPEAVQLVLQAAALRASGEVFTLDMGEPIKISDLARDMIELSGFEPGRDIEIQYTGVRPGEKLYEELFLAGEDYERTRHNKIFSSRNAASYVPSNLFEHIRRLARAADADDANAIMTALQELVPEFQPPVPVVERETKGVVAETLRAHSLGSASPAF